MAALSNPGELFGQMVQAASNAIGKDITTLEGFARDQVIGIAQLTVTLELKIANGEFAGQPDRQQTALDILRSLIDNFVNTVLAMSIVLAEKAWNAVVDVAWNALDKAAGFALPRPSF